MPEAPCLFYVILYLSQHKLWSFLPQTLKRSSLIRLKEGFLIQGASSTLAWDFCQIPGKKKRAVILKVFILSLAPVWHEESIAVRRRSRRRHNERQWNVGLCRNYSFTFCWPASRYIHWRKHQLDAQFIYSIVRQTPLHVSAVSTAHHQEIHRMDKTIGTYCYF